MDTATLQLEYRCTKAEMEEAQLLHLRQHYGGGSKWRTRLVLFGFLAFLIVGLYFEFKERIAPQDRSWFVALVVAVYVAMLIFKRMTRPKTDQLVRLDVSESGVAIDGGNGRTAMLWSAFSQCLESPKLFVLVDRPKAVLFAVPKRAFPDEAAQDWFRAQASQSQSVPAAVAEQAFNSDRFVAAAAIRLRFQLKFRDYLDRTITSWRTKGAFIGVFALVAGIAFFSPPPPHPGNPTLHAVNSPLKTVLIMSAIMLPMLLVMIAVVILVISFNSWRADKHYLVPQQILLTSDGIEFTSQDTIARLPWSTYKYYRESRWSFFVWQPRGSAWFMIPKREFTSPSDLTQFRAVLQTNLKPSRWLFL